MRKWKPATLLIPAVLMAHIALAQVNKCVLSIHPVFGNAPLQLGGSFYKLNNGDSVQIETFKFYISDIELLNNGKVVWREQNSFHLVDASQIQSLTILLNTPAALKFNRLKFNVGIDSATNVSGALGGDLDPTKGMYWAWQSGYINVKMEGKSDLCKTRNNEFAFHLGGYLKPSYCLQTVMVDATTAEKTDVLLDLHQFINNIDLSKQNEVMMPGKDAVLLSEQFAKAFSNEK